MRYQRKFAVFLQFLLCVHTLPYLLARYLDLQETLCRHHENGPMLLLHFEHLVKFHRLLFFAHQFLLPEIQSKLEHD